jgi:Holliday junction DNA helicase RuvA
VIEVGGVGYEVSLSPAGLAQLPALGAEVLLFIAESTAMYGGGTTLYGFLKAEQRQIFNVLRDNVPGTGAKKALEFLDKAMKSLPDFRRAVLDKDARALTTIFGFTAKTAEKIVAGLQNSLGDIPITAAAGRHVASSFEESIQGLVSLGYKEPVSRQAAENARAALGGDSSAQDLIREALRQLSGRT